MRTQENENVVEVLQRHKLLEQLRDKRKLGGLFLLLLLLLLGGSVISSRIAYSFREGGGGACCRFDCVGDKQRAQLLWEEGVGGWGIM